MDGKVMTADRIGPLWSLVLGPGGSPDGRARIVATVKYISDLPLEFQSGRKA